MEEYLKKINIFNFDKSGISLDSISDSVLDLYKSNGNKDEDSYKENNIIKFSYILQNNKFKIKYDTIEYEIEKEPFTFYNEKKEILGKTYTYEYLEKIMKALKTKFVIYNYNYFELKTKDDILNDENRKFILKEKNKFTEEKFKLLNSKREFNPSLKKPIIIPKSELSPIPSKQFHNKEKDIKIILENRNELIDYINKFMENWDEKILIIYGCDGIGKTVTFIYLSNLYNNYKVLYFNIKLIMSNKKESCDLFTFEIMRYFTISQKDINTKDNCALNYEKYLNEIKNIKKENFNFWEEIIKFFQSRACENDTLIIIDQYKDIYDLDTNFNLINLKNLILSEVSSFKLLICFSVNNTNIKNKLIDELKYCSLESSTIINSNNKNNINNKDIYENIFSNIDLDEEINYNENQDDGKFEKILLFNQFIDKSVVENKEKNEKDTNSINVNIINSKTEELDENSSSNPNQIKIIYINQLISIKNINNKDNDDNNNKSNKNDTNNINNNINNNKDNNNKVNENNNDNNNIENNNNNIKDNKNDEAKKNLKDNKDNNNDNKIINYLDIFDYNPKYYIKFKNFLTNNTGQLDGLYKKFLDSIYEQISDNIKKYYLENNDDILKNEQIIELIKLKDLVDNKVRFTAPILIQYIKEFPIKYIKMRIYDELTEKDSLSNNIIELNNQFKDTEFYFQFCFPFFGLILSKLIYLNDNNYTINYGKLSGSAKGSFMEQKIKRAIIIDKCFYEVIKLRYVWNFTSLNKDIPKDINEYDYENYERINYDEEKTNINFPYSVCYIVPGSQTNRNIDSALLIPDNINNNYKTFKLIIFQIKQGDNFVIKNKSDYVSSSFTAKKKFEKLYTIKISNVYFYFILPKEYKNENNLINDLENKNISYLFFSIFDHFIYKNDQEKLILLKYLINSNSEIFENDDNDNEEENFDKKMKIIIKLESCLKMKKFLGCKITRNVYENGRKIFFKKDKGLRLSNKQRESIINLLKNEFAIKNNFTIKYIFVIRRSEYLDFINKDDLFGIFYYKSNFYLLYNIFIIPIDINKNINNTEDINNVYKFIRTLKKDEQKSLRFKFKNKSINLEDINNENYIYIFKIYYV